MNHDHDYSSKLQNSDVRMMNEIIPTDGQIGSKKILVNPLIGGNIHYNRGKYTLASSTFGVTESTASRVRNDTVHYNPKFLGHSYVLKTDGVHFNPNYLGGGSSYVSTTSHAIHINPNFILPPRPAQPQYSFSSCSFENVSKYKYVRKDDTTSVSLRTATTFKCEPKTASKYKLVYSTAPSVLPVLTSPIKSGIVIRSKYSLRTCQPNPTTSPPTSVNQLINKESKKRIRCDFKRISRTKLVRKSVLRSRAGLKRVFKPAKFSRKPLFKLNRSRANSDGNIFKTYSRTKIVRKSVLRAHIASRKLLRKSLNSSVTNSLEMKPLIKSKYKLVLKRSTSNKKVESNALVKRSPTFNKSKRRRSTITKLTSKFRKNNKRCLFYNRFGRCKGKDKGTCNKIHDPLYISICKKLPFGECTDKKCLLSHDVRPGKMPTCYHYLAGICKRDNCPFLHIKVNPKAPICHSFLQGYCPDVFNCLKRHEYVCPVFAEKGSCPKGKSCAHPHKIPTVHSKLLADHQRPLMARPRPPSPPPPLPITSSDSCIFLISDEPEPAVKPHPSESPEDPTKLPSVFTRYFSVPISSAPDASSDSCLEHTPHESMDPSNESSSCTRHFTNSVSSGTVRNSNSEPNDHSSSNLTTSLKTKFIQ